MNRRDKFRVQKWLHFCGIWQLYVGLVNDKSSAGTRFSRKNKVTVEQSLFAWLRVVPEKADEAKLIDQYSSDRVLFSLLFARCMLEGPDAPIAPSLRDSFVLIRPAGRRCNRNSFTTQAHRPNYTRNRDDVVVC